MNKVKTVLRAFLPLLFAVSLAFFSMRILEKIGVPDGWWYFVIFFVSFALVMQYKEKIFRGNWD